MLQSTIPENHMAQQHMQSNVRMGGGNHFNNSTQAMMNAPHAGNMGNTSLGTKQQMLHYLVNQLKFPVSCLDKGYVVVLLLQAAYCTLL